jgi:gamma-glutamyl hercynylcysteine S-oxide synthase
MKHMIAPVLAVARQQDFADYRPYPRVADIVDGLEQAQTLTRALTSGREAEQLPLLSTLNPPLWELGHVAWFQEFWLHRGGNFDAPSLLTDADRYYDSARVHHDARWTLSLPSINATIAYGDTVLAQTRELLLRASLDERRAYFAQLALFHQDMHNEAFCSTWQTLGFSMPVGWLEEPIAVTGDILFDQGRSLIGAQRGGGFLFDNEKWAHEVDLPAFAISRSVVTNGEFRACVDAGAYTRDDLWCQSGRIMRDQLGLVQPRYWRHQSGAWQERRFDAWLPLDDAAPVRHLSAYETEVYCRWAMRRLPTEAEWERAARLPAEEFQYGQVWEWTTSRFTPFPGFSADPYKEYSEPWFAEEHRVLRGGSFVTPRRLMRPTLRNFYQPARADIFCGFRTCSI